MSNTDVRASKQRVTIELNGEKHELYFDLNAMSLIEDKFGTIMAGITQIAKGKVSAIKHVLWAGMTHNHIKAIDESTGEPTGYTITPFEVARHIDAQNISYITENLMNAINAGSPTDEEIEAARKDVDAFIDEIKSGENQDASQTQPTGTDPNE